MTCIGTSCNEQENALDDGLIAYYPFDGNTEDVTQNRSDGEIINDVTLTKDRLGREDGAYSFDGRSYIEVAKIAPYNNLSAFTLAAWIKPGTYRLHNSIISKVAPSRDFTLKIESDGRLNAHFAHLEPSLTYFHTTSPDPIPLGI